MPTLPNVPRKQLWDKHPRTKYGVAANLNKTGMYYHRFEQLFRCIRFSEQRVTRPYNMTDEAYRWQLVDDFIDAINEHRKANFTPSGLMCVDESIVRWYGLGGHWISKGLPHYVALDRKPENGAEIRNS